MLWTEHQKRSGWRIPREVYRERCQDEDGNRYTVIVLNDEIGVTTYRLDDGSPVRSVDDCEFEVMATGKFLSRCEG
ncbi:hypothetical protein [Bosea psychrotolerans]|uniref:Uncharacterized protein n=1 Tax=Bosea psychrotolerans TaxID=1871628 RepID=A0A2S4MCB7_9HYPH|nr:hypothetical protein [Bosea psychrotolerans]POR52376.1 hypothetical protein CYD53_10541 [Bosea psychrotolerans]